MELDKEKKGALPLKPQSYTKRPDAMITIYGRNPVLEALLDPSLSFFRLHLADSNKPADVILRITKLANKRQVDIARHSKQALSRISKNGRQDQGVALDIIAPAHASLEEHLARREDNTPRDQWLLVDGITNPQNLGMIIRSTAASPLQGIIIPQKGNASLDPLAIKASAGTLFRATILRTPDINVALPALKQHGYRLIGLAGDGAQPISDIPLEASVVYIVGSETHGLSEVSRKHVDALCSIPMNHGVESLNAAVTASIIAFRGVI